MTSFFDAFVEKARDVADAATKKTGEIVEISKYKLESVKINNEIEELYEQLGSAVYSMVKGGYDNPELIEGLTEDIDELMMNLDALNEKINDMKNVIHCNVCGSRNSVDNFYCAKCGSKLKADFEADQAYEADCECDEECDCCSNAADESTANIDDEPII